MEFEDNNDNIHKLKLENYYYLPIATKLLIRSPKNEHTIDKKKN